MNDTDLARQRERAKFWLDGAMGCCVSSVSKIRESRTETDLLEAIKLSHAVLSAFVERLGDHQTDFAVKKDNAEISRIIQYVRREIGRFENGPEGSAASSVLAEHLNWASAGLHVEAQRIASAPCPTVKDAVVGAAP